MTTLSKILSGIIVVLVLAFGFFFFTAKAPVKLGGVYGNPSYVNSFVTATSTVVASFPVVLHTVTLGAVNGNVVTIYNAKSTATATTSNIMAKLTESSSSVSLTFDGAFNSGITVTQTSASNVTLNYQQN